jgi:hypothetical protein
MRSMGAEAKPNRQNLFLSALERGAGYEEYKKAKVIMTERYPKEYFFQKEVSIFLGGLQLVAPAFSEWILNPKIILEKLTASERAMGILTTLVDTGFNIGTVVLAMSGKPIPAIVGVAGKIVYNIGVGAINELRERKK